jgi:hypothetical protein
MGLDQAPRDREAEARATAACPRVISTGKRIECAADEAVIEARTLVQDAHGPL